MPTTPPEPQPQPEELNALARVRLSPARAGAVVFATCTVVTLLVAAASVVAAARTPPPPRDPGRGPAPPGAVPDGQADLLAEGEDLYITGCSGCHGLDGTGVTLADGDERGPDLTGSGEAGAFFYLSTGRMPLGSNDAHMQRKPPAYDDDEIDALVAYVASLGDGPDLPELPEEAVTGDPAGGSSEEQAALAQGGIVFRENCQACHGAAGAGGALSYGRAAPSLEPSTPEEVAAAVRVGPGQMPVFGPEVIDDQQLAELVRYVRYLHEPEDPGGLPLGRIGPLPEGFIAWLVGMGGLTAMVAWIGTRNPVRSRRVASRGEAE